MAISPKQLNQAFIDEVDYYETKLDASLVNRKLGSSNSLTVDPPSGLTSDHVKVLRERYIMVGWKDLKLNHDQREGSWLEFTA